jgi:alkylhydroperoxidase family enzyme
MLMKCFRRVILASSFFALCGFVQADDVSDEPKIVPVTRDEVKEALDRLKYRKPRFPRREGEGQRGGNRERNRDGASREGANGAGANREGRNRQRGGGGGGLSRGDDPVMSLDYPFSVELFWIVSRVNNCHYCLGHQENKLLSAGLTDDRIAALDGHWDEFTPAEQAAFGFTRKLTYTPHLVNDADIAALKQHYTDLQALEIVYYVSRYNYMNRRTDGMGLAQQENRVFKTPTSEKYQSFASTTAPIDPSRPAGTLAPALIAPRPELESRAEVLARLAECKTRQPRFPLVDDAKSRELLPDYPAGPIPSYARLLANFPRTGVSSAESQRRSDEQGEVAPLLRAQIAWIAARNDRSWYALGRAMAQLQALGQTEDQIFSLDSPEGKFSSAEQAAFRLTKKFSLAPQRITDADVEAVRKEYGDVVGAEIVSRNTQAAFINRLSEAAALPLD